MTTCPACGLTLEPTASGQFLACPQGHGKLVSPKGTGGLVNVAKEAGVEFGPPKAIHVFPAGWRPRDGLFFEIQGYPYLLWRLARGQGRTGREVVALRNGRKRTFVPVEAAQP